MQEPRKTPTIQDVARFAKVSTATVSRALSAPEKVSEATRARVSEAVRVTGYTLNQTARSLRQRSAKAILVALPDIRNPFFSSILDAVEREAASRGYGVLVINLYFGRQTVARLQDFLLSNRADGLLLLDGSIELEQLQALREQAAMVPVVLACEEIPKSGFHMVLTDNVEAAERATRHLIDLGHTRIGHLLGPEQNIVSRERHSGFNMALEKAGLTVRPDWCLRGNFEMETGYAAAAQFLSLPDRPTAFFASNDESAIGFLSGLRQHGIICPRDISIIGFDDLGVTPHIDPPLTTMRQPREMLGRMATEALIDMIEDSANREQPLRVVLRSELVVRQSTGRPVAVNIRSAALHS